MIYCSVRIQLLTLTLAAVCVAWAQPGGGPGGGRGPMRPSPLVAALDTDHDGSISAAEMAAAPQALATLDKNGDGRIALEEVMVRRPEGAERGGEQGGGAVSPDLVNTLFSFDENKDGKLSKAEVPERMQGIFLRADSDHDGLLTRDELTKATVAQDRRAPGGPPPDLVFRALDKDNDGVLSPPELAGAAAALKTLDKNGDGVLNEQELRPMRGPGGPGGRGGPGEMINHLFEENDANHDGKLSKAEMPERMREMFERADLNQDGFVTRDEITKAFESMRPQP